MSSLILFIYTMVLLVVAPFLLFGLLRKRPNKPIVGSRWKELFGFTPPLTTISHEVVWIHAVSVGETIAVTPFIKALKKSSPTTTIVLTTTTPTGAQQAKSLREFVEHRYMPIDFSFSVSRFLKTIKPNKLIIVETELWPNTINIVAKNNIPISILNARLSEKSFRGYQKVRWLFATIAPKLNKVLCLHNDDKERFRKLGIPEDNLVTTGSIKFDISVDPADIQLGRSLREEFGNERFVWVAASTHQGEDEKILAAHKELLNSKPDALLILTPRHPERFSSVTKLASQGLQTITRSSNQKANLNTQVYVADSMGEMMKLLSSADLCFMGGSLLGSKVGGHNLLEPAAIGLPSIIGPSYYNFTDITNQLVSNNACTIVQNEKDLAKELIVSADQHSTLAQRGELAKLIVEQNSGALSKSLHQIFGQK